MTGSQPAIHVAALQWALPPGPRTGPTAGLGPAGPALAQMSTAREALPGERANGANGANGANDGSRQPACPQTAPGKRQVTPGGFTGNIRYRSQGRRRTRCWCARVNMSANSPVSLTAPSGPGRDPHLGPRSVTDDGQPSQGPPGGEAKRPPRRAAPGNTTRCGSRRWDCVSIPNSTHVGG